MAVTKTLVGCYCNKLARQARGKLFYEHPYLSFGVFTQIQAGSTVIILEMDQLIFVLYTGHLSVISWPIIFGRSDISEPQDNMYAK